MPRRAGQAGERRAEETCPRSPRVGRNHLPQLLSGSLKGALFTLVILVSLRHTGYLALESLKPRYGFDYEGDARGWRSRLGMPHRHRIWNWPLGGSELSLWTRGREWHSSEDAPPSTKSRQHLTSQVHNPPAARRVRLTGKDTCLRSAERRTRSM